MGYLTTYTTDDQEFFFDIATQILDRFRLLDGVPEKYLDDIVINFSTDILYLLEEFKKIKGTTQSRL